MKGIKSTHHTPKTSLVTVHEGLYLIEERV